MIKPTVLIIDDVLENVQVLGEALAHSCRVQFASSGEEGLELLQQSRPDLILLDVMMPGMSGYEVFSRLRAETDYELIPIIFVTAKNDATSESEAINAGAADFIHKPINPEVVRARVKMHLELAKHRKHMEQLVLARTHELATARAEAESANAVKTRFMTNVSHEMRTPLQGILGFSEIGRMKAKDLDSQRILEYFDNILESGKRMHVLVESLLTLAEDAWRKQAGLDAHQKQVIDLHDFVAEVINLAELRAEKRQQRIVVEIQSTISSFVGDANRLRQVVEHLLNNALTYSPPGTTVTLRVQDSQLRGRRGSGIKPALSLLVIDHGCGIPESEMNAVFEPFYQSTRTATGAGGTGLGLPLSRCILQRHNGTMKLANRPEGGVSAEIVLPIAEYTAD